MSAKNNLRSALLKSSAFKSKTVKIDEGGIEVREPSRKAVKAAQVASEEGSGGKDFGVILLIYSCYDAESGDRIFEINDYDSIMEQGIGADNVFTKLSVALNEMMEEADTEKK